MHHASFAERWLCGFGFLIQAWFMLFVAFGPPYIVDQMVNEVDSTPDWLRMVVDLGAVGYSIVFGPLILYWIARKAGIPLERQGKYVVIAGTQNQTPKLAP